MKTIIKFTFIIVFSFSALPIKSQNEYVSVPSANAASGIKSGDIPVNYNNGTSQVAIPITAIQDYDLSLPISLTYQTGGIRVSEVSSAVGTGWNLQYGATITRMVR